MMQDDDIRINQFLKNLDHIVLLDTLMGFGTPIAVNTGTDIHLSEKDFLSSFPASAAPLANMSHNVSELPPRRGLDERINTFFAIFIRVLCLLMQSYGDPAWQWLYE